MVWVNGKGTQDIGAAPTGLPQLLGAPTDVAKEVGKAIRPPVRLVMVAVAQRQRWATVRWLQP